MSEKKLSSVEWLEKALYTYAKLTGIDKDKWVIKEETLDKLFEQAKAMHKQEMVDFGNDLIAHIGIPNLAEQYYNQIFGE